MDNQMAERITEQVTVPMVLSRYGFPTSNRKRIPCPLHSGKDPNFCYTDKVFHCWTCGAKGNVISLTMQLHGITFPQALIRLNTDFGLGLPAQKPSIRDRQQLIENKRVLAAYRKWMTEKERLYGGLCVLHRELWRRMAAGEADEETVLLQQELEEWLQENIGEVVQPWQI